jgi:hypothetical protein
MVIHEGRKVLLPRSQFIEGPTMTDERSVEVLISWLNERLDNCQRIAAQKRGADRMGWLEDAAYFREAAAALLREKARADGAEKKYRYVIKHVNYGPSDDGMTWASWDWCVDVASMAPESIDAAIDAALSSEPCGLPMTDERSVELLPCPFCGCKKTHVFQPTCNQRTPYNPSDRAYPTVRCALCYAETCGNNWDESASSAVDKWNIRSDAALLREKARADEAVNVLTLIEMESRDGGQWTMRDVNEVARAALSSEQSKEGGG